MQRRVSASRRRIREFDRLVDSATSRLRTKNGDRFFYRLTESANHSILWHLVNVAGLLARNKTSFLPKRLLRTAIALGVESALVNGVIKKAFSRGRPVHDDIAPHRLRTPKTTSFPSGHATSAFGAAVLLGHDRSMSARVAVYGLACLVSFSRIYVRLHHASDVLAGAAFGYLFGQAVKRAVVGRAATNKPGESATIEQTGNERSAERGLTR